MGKGIQLGEFMHWMQCEMNHRFADDVTIFRERYKVWTLFCRLAWLEFETESNDVTVRDLLRNGIVLRLKTVKKNRFRQHLAAILFYMLK